MSRYHVFELGLDGKRLGTVEAETLQSAKVHAARRYNLDVSELRLEPIHEREEVTCGECGWKFMSPKPFMDRERTFVRCTLCSKEVDVEHKARIFLKVQEEYDVALKKRAKEYGLTTAQYKSLKEQKKLPPR